MDIGTIWHCARVSCIPSQSIWLFWVCAVMVLSVMCAMIMGFLWPSSSPWTTQLGFVRPGSSGSATKHLPGCIWLLTSCVNKGLNVIRSDSFMSCLDSLLGYSSWEFQALQLIVLAVFGKKLYKWYQHLKNKIGQMKLCMYPSITELKSSDSNVFRKVHQYVCMPKLPRCISFHV